LKGVPGSNASGTRSV